MAAPYWVDANGGAAPQEIGSIQIAAAYQRELPQYRRLYRTAQIRDDTYSCTVPNPACRCDRLKSQQQSPNNAPHPKKTPLNRKRRRTPPSHRPEGLRREAKAEPTERPHHEGQKKRRKKESRDPSTERRGRGWKHKRSLDYMAINSIATADWITADV